MLAAIKVFRVVILTHLSNRISPDLDPACGPLELFNHSIDNEAIQKFRLDYVMRTGSVDDWNHHGSLLVTTFLRSKMQLSVCMIPQLHFNISSESQ